MALTENEKLAAALEKAASLSVNNIVHSKLLTARERALLNKHGFLKPIIRGWFMLDADTSTHNAGESALWFDSIWGFVSQYLFELFGDNYWLSPESSLDLLTSSNALPKQIIVYANTSTRTVSLPHDMGLLIINSPKIPYKVIRASEVNVISMEGLLADIAPSAYRRDPLSLQLALRMADISELAQAFEHTRNVAALGRVLGAYKAMGKTEEYQQLKRIVDGIGLKAQEENNPFEQPIVNIGERRNENAAAMRVRALWHTLRDDVEQTFSKVQPKFNFADKPIESILADIEELYIQDAYHSLSIEGYRVTPELIEKVRMGSWDPVNASKDREAKDALAARGYFEAFNAVKASLTAMHKGTVSSLSYAVATGVTDWYTSLFQPCVTVGLISPKDIAGYRKGPVYIRTSRHAPPADIYLRDCMDALKELIDTEPSYPVKAVLGHLCLGYIHPFPDGNGRTARFLMNFLFTLGGYDWCIVHLEDRNQYLDSLNLASLDQQGKAFAEFIRESMEKTNR
ncbi:Fic family protein [Paraneptunicella aestuarii]|uniref:Fic family protein n=1 Tax=Paraneptunicella aestuarii TaxID=2831148 RepID=UPI001E3D1517|nr:Fic family protein [Paraneptunicella aestuarii]UAA39623.1 Fic family protein [Paraneptunicella aestuarii]